MELHGADAGDAFRLGQGYQHVQCMIIWYALYAPTTLRHLIFGGWTCILNLFTDFFKGISENSIGWIFSVWAKKANAGRFERGYLKVTTENLTCWIMLRCEKPPKTNF